MSGKNYLDMVINQSIKRITERLNEYKNQKPWKYQKHVDKIKKDLSDNTKSLSKKTVRCKKKTPPKKDKISKLPSDKSVNNENRIKRNNKRSDRKTKRRKLEEKIETPNSEAFINKFVAKKDVLGKSRKDSLLKEANNKDILKKSSDKENEKKEVEKPETTKSNGSYRFKRRDIFCLDEDNNILENFEKSEDKKRRERHYTKKKTLIPESKSFCVDGKDPDEEFLNKLSKLDIPISIKKKEGSIEQRLNIEELALNYATKHPRSSIGSKIMGPYEMETIEDALKKHPNVKPKENKNFDGRVMSNLKRPFWHQIDPIPLLMGKQEDTTDDTLPINADMLKSFEQGKLKVENKINLKPKKPNPFGSLRDIIKQNDMFSGEQIFGNTMRAIVKFKPKHLRNTMAKVDSVMILEDTLKNQQNKSKEKVKINPLPVTDDTTAEEEFDNSAKKLIKERENNILLTLPKTKIIYKRNNPCIWKEIPLYKKKNNNF